MVLASETDQIADGVGFRTIKTRGTDILLNDQPVFLRGICIHEENPMRGGRAYSVEDARMLLGWAKELTAKLRPAGPLPAPTWPAWPMGWT